MNEPPNEYRVAIREIDLPPVLEDPDGNELKAWQVNFIKGDEIAAEAWMLATSRDAVEEELRDIEEFFQDQSMNYIQGALAEQMVPRD